MMPIVSSTATSLKRPQPTTTSSSNKQPRIPNDQASPRAGISNINGPTFPPIYLCVKPINARHPSGNTIEGTIGKKPDGTCDFLGSVTERSPNGNFAIGTFMKRDDDTWGLYGPGTITIQNTTYTCTFCKKDDGTWGFTKQETTTSGTPMTENAVWADVINALLEPT